MSATDILFPKIKLRHLPFIFSWAFLGAGIAGTYGIIHDQITYSLSQEYFTKFKFLQFHHTDFGFPVRFHVAEVGFLATWWVGFVAGWFLARYSIQYFSPKLAIKYVLQGFGIILGFAFLFGLWGFLFGFFWLSPNHLDSWRDFQTGLDIIDVRSFALVGYIHNCGYLGALFGLVLAMFYLKRIRNSP